MSKATGIKGYTPDRLRRSKEAAARRETRASRNDEQQLTALDGRPGSAQRERLTLVGIGGVVGPEVDE